MNPEDRRALLTDRWFPLPAKVMQHEEQARVKAALSRHGDSFHVAVIAAGRRSFKTERFLKRHFVRMSALMEGEKNFLGAPTRPQAKLIFWDDVKALSPPYLVRETNETELRIDYVNGGQLYVVGLKEYDRVHGVRWNRIGITEYQEVSSKLFATTLQPILIDTKGQGVLEGRPMGRNHFYDDFLRAKTSPERWSSFHWKSAEILSEEQIKAAKDDLGIVDYQREYDASFESGSQKVYYGYSELNHKPYSLDAKLPVLVTCDFNAGEKPMSWSIGQQIGENTYWTNSLSYQYTNTATMCGILHDLFAGMPSYPKLLKFYGDYSGTKDTSNSSFSDWEIIKNFFNNKTDLELRIKPCLSVRNRVGATNARLCNANNVRRTFVDPEKCKPLIKDWEYVQWQTNNVDLDDKNPERTHSSDAVDYYNDYEFPITPRATGRQYGS